MTTAFFLIVLGTLSRLAPHPPNAVAMGALALYAGARLPRRWAYLVPIVAMAASDLWLDWGSHDEIDASVRPLLATVLLDGCLTCSNHGIAGAVDDVADTAVLLS